MTEQTKSTSSDGAPRKSFVKRLTAIKPSDLVILFFLCVFVGMILAFLNVNPADLWVDFFGAVTDAWREFFGSLGSAIQWSIQYFLLGAVIIVPIWLLFHVIRALNK